MGAMITTEDNPFDPRLDFQQWYAWDVEHGYNTCAYLDRVSMTSNEYPPEFINKEIENAIDEIIAMHSDGLYKKLPIDDAA